MPASYSGVTTGDLLVKSLKQVDANTFGGPNGGGRAWRDNRLARRETRGVGGVGGSVLPAGA